MSFASPRSPNSGSSSLCHPTCEDLPRQWFRFAAVGTSSPAHQGFIRGAIALQTPASSGQHRSPVCGPIAGPCQYAYEQVHEESQGTDHAVWYDPFLTQSPAATREEKRVSPWRAPRNNHTPDRTVLPNCDQPNMFRITLPAPGDTRELSGHNGQATLTAHPGMISTLPGSPWILFIQKACPHLTMHFS